MDFTKGFAGKRERVRMGAAGGDAAEGVLTDDLTAFLGLLVDDDLIRSVDLVIGEDTILKEEPPRSPSLAVVDPLVQNPRYSIPHNVVHPNRRSPRYRFRRRSLDQPVPVVACLGRPKSTAAAAADGPPVCSGMRPVRRRGRWVWHFQQLRQRPRMERRRRRSRQGRVPLAYCEAKWMHAILILILFGLIILLEKVYHQSDHSRISKPR